MQRLLPSLLALAALVLLPAHAAPAARREPVALPSSRAAYREPAAALVSSRATSSPLDLVSQLSTCALSCLITHAPEYGCSVVDIECQCASKPLNEALATCMVMNCTADEAIALAKVDQTQCNRATDSKNGEFVRVYHALSFLIYAPFALRMVSRAFITKTLWWDDFFHFVAVFITFFITYLCGQLAELGFGNHLAQVQAKDLQTFWMWSYVGQILWATSILALKVSVLCFYLHLFPDRKFKMACSAVLGIMVVGGTGFILWDVFQCMPVSDGWTLQRGADAKCTKLSVVAMSGAGFNVLSEIAILILPMPVLATLQLKLRKKIGVIALLGLGFVTIVVSVVRIPFLRDIDGYYDSTYRFYPGFQWTAVEVVTAHFVVAAPAVSALFKVAYAHLTTAVRNSAYLGSRGSKEKTAVSHDSSPTPATPSTPGRPTSVAGRVKTAYGCLATAVRRSAFLGSRRGSRRASHDKVEVSHESALSRSPTTPASKPLPPTPPTPPSRGVRRQGVYDVYGVYDLDFDDDDEDDLNDDTYDSAPAGRPATPMPPMRPPRVYDVYGDYDFDDENYDATGSNDDEIELRRSRSSYVTASSSLTSSVRASFGSTLSQVLSTEKVPYSPR